MPSRRENEGTERIPKCKGTTLVGQQCRNMAVLDGYCVMHYWVMREEEGYIVMRHEKE